MQHRLTTLATAAASVIAIGSIASAATYDWSIAGSGDWNVDANWSGTGVPGTTAADNDEVRFGSSVTGTATVDLENATNAAFNPSVAVIRHSDDNNITITKNTLFLSNSGGNAIVDVTGSGTLTIASGVNATGETLEKTGSGKLIFSGTNTNTYASIVVSDGILETPGEKPVGNYLNPLSVSSGASFLFKGANGKTIGAAMPFTIGGTGDTAGLGALRFESTSSGNFTITSTVTTTTSDATIVNAMGGTLSQDRINVLSGKVTGSGLVLDSTAFSGALAGFRTGFQLSGTAANDNTGSVTVKGHNLVLGKSAGVDAISAGGLIADGTQIFLTNDNQINGDATVTLKNSSVLSLSQTNGTTARADAIKKLVIDITGGSVSFVSGQAGSRLVLGSGTHTTTGLHLTSGGELDVNGSYSVTILNIAGGSYDFDVATNDLTNVTANNGLTISNTSAVTIAVTGALSGEKTLFNYLGTLNGGSFSNGQTLNWTVTGAPGAYAKISDAGNAIVLVPEPAALSLLALAAIPMIRRRRA